MPDAAKMNRFYKTGAYEYLESQEFKTVYSYISKSLVSSGVKSILDIGCWTGMLCDSLYSNGYKGKYLGYDISDRAIMSAKRVFRDNPNASFKLHSWKSPSPPGSFDAVYAGGVFYYIPESGTPETKEGFFQSQIDCHRPKVVVIQDLAHTDLGFIENLKGFHVTKKNFYVDAQVRMRSDTKERQVYIMTRM